MGLVPCRGDGSNFPQVPETSPLEEALPGQTAKWCLFSLHAGLDEEAADLVTVWLGVGWGQACERVIFTW